MQDQPRRPTYAVLYLLGMSVATVCGTAFVVGGMLAGARGLTAVALAAIIPIAGLLWALVLSTIDRGNGLIDRNPTWRPASHPNESDNNTPSGPLVGPGQNHR